LLEGNNSENIEILMHREYRMYLVASLISALTYYVSRKSDRTEYIQNMCIFKIMFEWGAIEV